MISEFIKKVVISRRAYEDLVIYASRYASHLIDPNDQREVYGILVGHINKEKAVVYVRQAIGIVVGSRTGVEFENKQYVDLSNIDESIFKKSLEYETGDFICGWWHTHPGFGFFYSHTDILNHIGFQAANPFAIGLIYDYSQRKTAVNDPGLEALRLDRPEPMHALTEKITVEIEELGQCLTNLDHILEEKVKAVQIARKSIDYISETLEKKRFAQIQRNYGLLLLKKHQKKLNSKELKQMSEEDRFLYEWNEADVKEKYIVPKFREQLEKDIANFQKHKDKRGQGQKQLEKTLLKPKKAVQEVYSEFNALVEQMQPVRRWFDAEERLIVSNIAFKFEQYINILNALITKTYYLLPHDIDLDPQLFDEKVLGKVLYGNEDASTVETKAIGDIPIQPATAQSISEIPSEESIQKNEEKISQQAIATQQAAEALKESIENDLEKEEEEVQAEKMPSKIAIPKINNTNTFVIPKIKAQTPKPMNTKLPDVEPIIKTKEGVIIADPEFLPPNEQKDANRVSGSPIKVNMIQPIQIDMKPISINGHKNKLEIDFDEIFDDGWSDK